MNHQRRRHFDLKQKKSLGQVFLRESWPCEKVADQLSSRNINHVIEIGPGGGVLTRELLKRGIHVTAVEKDHRFSEKLHEIFAPDDYPGKLSVVNDDILKFSLSQWMDQQKGLLGVCGNIPYNVSTPILNWVLPEIHRLRSVWFMVQLEFAQRITSLPGNKSYGSLSIYAQLRAKTQFQFFVSKNCFKPIPKVDSAFFSLSPLKNRESDTILNKVEQLTRKAFTQRRKKLLNSLSGVINHVDANDLGIDLGRRCETLSPQEFVDLAKTIIALEEKTASK